MPLLLPVILLLQVQLLRHQASEEPDTALLRMPAAELRAVPDVSVHPGWSVPEALRSQPGLLQRPGSAPGELSSPKELRAAHSWEAWLQLQALPQW